MTQSARKVGIAPINRKRLEVAGVDLDALRGQTKDTVARMRSVHVPGEAYEACRQAAYDLAYLERTDWRPEDVVRDD